MFDSESACPWGRENRAGRGRKAKPMLYCISELEDDDPAKVRSVCQGCVGLESSIWLGPAELARETC